LAKFKTLLQHHGELYKCCGLWLGVDSSVLKWWIIRHSCSFTVILLMMDQTMSLRTVETRTFNIAKGSMDWSATGTAYSLQNVISCLTTSSHLWQLICCVGIYTEQAYSSEIFQCFSSATMASLWTNNHDGVSQNHLFPTSRSV